MISKQKHLKYIRTDDSITKAKEIINNERSGKQYGLLSRFKSLNRAVGKYFRFKNTYFKCGRSGSGKSALSNMLRTDFLNIADTVFTNTEFIYLGDHHTVIPSGRYAGCKYYPHSRMIVNHDGTYHIPAINRRCEYNVLVVNVGPEMPPETELIRNASSIVGKSYMNILSSEYDYEAQEYTLLNDDDYACIEEALDSMQGRKEYYIPVSGTLEQLSNSIDIIANANPNHKIVICIDHTLLLKRLPGQSESDHMESFGMWAIDTRDKYEAMIIPLSQFNNEIEKPERKKPAAHYPIKADIHYGSKVWWAADFAILWNRPEMLGITAYGPEGLVTTDLIHGRIAKGRNSGIGNIWLRADFEYGRILEVKKGYFKAA